METYARGKYIQQNNHLQISYTTRICKGEIPLNYCKQFLQKYK